MSEAVQLGGGTSALDLPALREQFPALRREVHGRPVVYFDNAATTHKPVEVLEAMERFHTDFNANVHRGVHRMAVEATEAFERARRAVAEYLHAPGVEQVVLTSGTTDSINGVAQGWLAPRLEAGDEILVTGLEHHSNIVPWQLVAEPRGAKLAAIPVRDDGSLDLDAAASRIHQRTRLLAVNAVSNALGSCNDIVHLSSLAREAGIPLLVDAAQALAHGPVDVQAWDADFVALSGHKVFGPTGIGALWIAPRRLEQMRPWRGGGEMISSVRIESSSWADPPHRFEAGTPNIVGAIGLGAALRFMASIEMPALQAHEDRLTRRLTERMTAVDGIRLIGAGAPQRVPIVSFVFDDVHPHDAGQFLDQRGVAVRVGHHCAEPLMRRFGVAGTVRASLALYNIESEIDRLVEGVRETVAFFAR